MVLDILTRSLFILLLVALTARQANGQKPKVRGSDQRSGVVLRIWGIGTTGQGPSPVLGVLTRLEAEFQRLHPEVSFTHHLSGNDSALGGLYVNAADVALMDREPSYIELDGYQQVITGQKPFAIRVMRGGVQVGGHSSPLVVVVNQKNPIERLSVAELDSAFNTPAHARADGAPQTWGDLGLTGEWAVRPLHLYGFEVESAEARTFSKIAMSDTRRWVCVYQEIKNKAGANSAKNIATTVAGDLDGLGVTTFDAVTGGTKVVAIANAAGVARLPTRESLSSGEYVLERTVQALARAGKDGRPESKVRDFLNYLVSADAQAIISADGTYVPLEEKAYAPKEALR